MPNLNTGILANIPLNVPEKKAQKRIAKVLSTLDAKIELNRRINGELEGMAKLLYDYWFVQFDFPMSSAAAAAMGRPDLAGKPYRASGGKMVYQEELKREIPDGWEVKPLSAVCHQIRESVSPSAVDPTTPYVGLEHVPRRQFFLNKWETSHAVTSLKNQFKKGDILFGKLRPYFHKVVRSPIDGICSSELLVLRAKKANFEALIGSILFSDTFVEFTSNQWGGSKMPRADWKRMREYTFACPPNEEIEDFQNCILKLWNLAAIRDVENQHLTTLRDWLLPMLMNGQVTVRDPASAPGQEG
jgi:type I restriction enzyme S subunit